MSLDPASPLPIAIVGLGFGRHIVDNLQSPEYRRLFQIAAVCDLDPEKTSRISAATGARVVTFEELLADPDLPIVGLFTGPAGRAGLIRRLIRAGKHVMTTKPFERDSTAARLVLEEARSLGRIVHLNSPAPTLPSDLALVRKWQQTHDLGEPIAGHFSTWAYYEEKPDGGWLDDPALCPVAPIFRLGIYMINDAIEIFGAPDEVQVMASRLSTGRPTPDHAQLSVRFRSGALVSMLASFCIRDGDWYRTALTLNFQRGTVYRNEGPEGKAGGPSALALVVERDNKPLIIERAQPALTSGAYYWEAFHDAVLTGELPPESQPEKVAAGIRVIEAMAESEKQGRPVKVHAS